MLLIEFPLLAYPFSDDDASSAPPTTVDSWLGKLFPRQAQVAQVGAHLELGSWKLLAKNLVNSIAAPTGPVQISITSPGSKQLCENNNREMDRKKFSRISPEQVGPSNRLRFRAIRTLSLSLSL